MDSINREEIINDFKNNQKGLIANARCLIEGVDVPEVDAKVSIINKRSKNRYCSVIRKSCTK